MKKNYFFKFFDSDGIPIGIAGFRRNKMAYFAIPANFKKCSNHSDRNSVGILKFRRGIKINLKIPANEQIIPRTVSESGGIRRIPTGFRSESSDSGRIPSDPTESESTKNSGGVPSESEDSDRNPRIPIGIPSESVGLRSESDGIDRTLYTYQLYTHEL